MTEEWKKIEGYDWYEVSTFGRIRSLSKGCCHMKILKPYLNKGGYFEISLYGDKEKKRKVYRIHRIVAETFIENTNNYQFVNHKDENKTNNRVDNLEWCTHQYNDSYGTRGERISKKLKNHSGMSKKVEQLTMDGKHVEFYPSVGEASRQTGFNRSHIANCCRGILKHHKYFVWRYV